MSATGYNTWMNLNKLQQRNTMFLLIVINYQAEKIKCLHPVM